MAYAPIDALYASDGVAPAVRATISSERLPGDMDVITDSVANWPHKGIATSGTPDDDGVILPGTECVFEYVLSGTIIHITGFAPGYYDTGHTENQIVILKPTTHHTDSLVNALEDFEALPAGGTAGQILTKVSSTDGDAEWDDAPEAGNSIVTKEAPTGTVDGSNTSFFTSQPYIAATLQVYINGLAQSFEVTETDPTTGEFTISPAPLTGDDLVVSYMFGAVGTMAADTVDGYHANATPTPDTIPVLDSGGKLPVGAIPTQEAFKAYVSSDYAITSGAYRVIQFGVESFDIGGMYDHSNYRAIAPVDGVYRFETTVRVNSASTNGYIAYSVNGGGEKRLGQKGPNIYNAAFMEKLTAGDYVEILVYSYDNTTISGGDLWSRFSGSLVSRT